MEKLTEEEKRLAAKREYLISNAEKLQASVDAAAEQMDIINARVRVSGTDGGELMRQAAVLLAARMQADAAVAALADAAAEIGRTGGTG